MSFHSPHLRKCVRKGGIDERGRYNKSTWLRLTEAMYAEIAVYSALT